MRGGGQPSLRPKSAFTLAEVLITLGIIGVVAAMTLPALIQKQQRLETTVRLKKFYSVMNQAILAAQSEQGDSRYWTKQEYIVDDDVGYDYEKYNKEAVTIFNSYLLPHLKILKLTEGQTPGEGPDGKPIAGALPQVYFPDGSSMQLKMGSCFDIYFDSNGDRKPNVYGKDMFMFFFCYKNNKPMISAEISGESASYSTRAKALEKCKTSKNRCAVLLQKFDNWEFKKDYPW